MIKNPEQEKSAKYATLKDVLENSDHREKSILELAHSLRSNWNRLVLSEYKADKPRLPEFSEVDGVRQLPAQIVDLSGTTICIHGVLHGLIGAGEGASTKVGKIVHQYVEWNQKFGGVWITESGLGEDFQLDDYFELDDVEDFYGQRLGGMNWEGKSILYVLKDVGSFGLEFVRDYIGMVKMTSFSGDPEMDKIIADVGKGILFSKDPRYFLLLQKLRDQFELPEPLGMEVGFTIFSKGDLTKKALGIDRSLFEARGIESIISDNEEARRSTVHVIVGDAHRRQVAYFLTHPHYDMRESLKSAQEVLRHRGSTRTEVTG